MRAVDPENIAIIVASTLTCSLQKVVTVESGFSQVGVWCFGMKQLTMCKVHMPAHEHNRNHKCNSVAHRQYQP